VYAVHLETMVKLSPEKRAEQARAVTDDAKRFSGPVVIAGDFNDYAMAACMHREGFRWLTEWLGPTHKIFPMDHILTRGLVPVEPGGVGVVHQVHGASDHHPVWAVLQPALPDAPTWPDRPGRRRRSYRSRLALQTATAYWPYGRLISAPPARDRPPTSRTTSPSG